MVIDGLLVFLVCDVDLFVCVIVALALACRALACRTLGVVVCVLALWICCGERLGMTVVWSRVCGVCGVGGAVEAMLTLLCCSTCCSERGCLSLLVAFAHFCLQVVCACACVCVYVSVCRRAKELQNP